MGRATIQEGDRVQMSKYATAFRGVKGQVIKIDEDPYVPTLDPFKRPQDRRNIYIMTDLTYNGKRVVVKASPYELDGGVLDDRPILSRG